MDLCGRTRMKLSFFLSCDTRCNLCVQLEWVRAWGMTLNNYSNYTGEGGGFRRHVYFGVCLYKIKSVKNESGKLWCFHHVYISIWHLRSKKCSSKRQIRKRGCSPVSSSQSVGHFEPTSSPSLFLNYTPRTLFIILTFELLQARHINKRLVEERTLLESVSRQKETCERDKFVGTVANVINVGV